MTGMLSGSSVAVGDGAMGTMLQLAGLPVGTAPEAWNLERQHEVRRVHNLYSAAGCRWLTTNTFGANRPRLAAHGLAGRLFEINTSAVRAATDAAPGLPRLLSVGPTGGDPSTWAAAYSEQCEIPAGLVAGYLVETIVSLPEGLAAVRAAVAARSGLVIASFTPGPDGRLLDGTTPESAAEALVRAGAAAIGVNCGSGPASLLAPARRLVAAEQGPVYAAPNAGLPVDSGGGLRYDLPLDAFVEAAIQFGEMGVRLFAGCCGTTPDHLRAAAAALSGLPGER